MNRKPAGVGALHPVLFFMVVYGISLFLAFFVCRTVYYTVYGNEAASENTTKVEKGYSMQDARTATALK